MKVMWTWEDNRVTRCMDYEWSWGMLRQSMEAVGVYEMGDSERGVG